MGLFNDVKSVFKSQEKPIAHQSTNNNVQSQQKRQTVDAKNRIIVGSNTKIQLGRQKNKTEVFALKMRSAWETTHTLITGTTGSGKSQMFYSWQDQINARNEKALIVDHGGENIRRYYDEKRGDIILNPFDLRGSNYNVFNEIKNNWDADNIARYCMPNGSGGAAEWNRYAQIFIAGVLKSCIRIDSKTMKDLHYFIALATTIELRELLAGQPAAVYLEKGNEKMFGSIRSIAVGAVECWQYMTNSEEAFSIRKWIANDGDKRWVFLSYRESMYASIRSYIAMCVSIAITYSLETTINDDRRIWLLLDEFASLTKIDPIMDALTKGRKYGLCVVAGLQSTAQAEIIYGRLEAQAMYSCFNTWIASRPGDAATAEMFSKHFGEQEFLSTENGGRSQGISSSGLSSSESINIQLKKQAVIGYSDIMMLDNMVFVAKFPGNIPVSYGKTEYVDGDRKKLHEAFVSKYTY